MRISDWSSDVCSSDLSSGDLPQADLEEAHDRQHEDEAGGQQHDGVGGALRPVAAGVEPAVDDLGEPQAGRPAENLRSRQRARSEEHTSELQSLMRISYAVFCLKKKKYKIHRTNIT